jgi:hypothetical protein
MTFTRNDRAYKLGKEYTLKEGDTELRAVCTGWFGSYGVKEVSIDGYFGTLALPKTYTFRTI